MNFKTKKEVKRMAFENDEQFKWRMETGEILSGVVSLLDNISKLQTQPNQDIGFIAKRFKALYDSLDKVKTPKEYESPQYYLFNCLNEYKRGSELLVKGILSNNAAITNKAARFINAGNHWMELSKIEIFNVLEEVQFNYKKEG